MNWPKVKECLSWLLSAGVALALSSGACSSSQQNGIMVKVNTAKPDARFKVEVNHENAVIEIFSESGLGSATIELTSDAVPKKMTLRFHLRGLEELRFGYDETVVTASLSSTDARQIRQSFSRAGGRPIKETAIAADSPYWMKLRVVALGGARQTLPLQNGYIEAEAPEDFFKSGTRRVTIHWIDFYR